MEHPFDPMPDFTGKTACCFTGHRPDGLPRTAGDMVLLKLRLMRAIRAAYDGGVRTFLAGGAQGFDQLAAEAVLFQKENWPDVRLLLALPAPTQAKYWQAGARQRYDEVLNKADKVWYASDATSTDALLRRNRYLVEHADCCIAYLQKLSGGTLYTVRYALEREISVYNLAQIYKT